MKRSVKGKVRQDDIHYILFVGGPLIGKICLLEEGETIIGRAANADIAIDDNRIGRRHARITAHGTEVIIEDLNSANGTFVNGERITRRVLENGDKVHLTSDTIFKFAVGDRDERDFVEELCKRVKG